MTWVLVIYVAAISTAPRGVTVAPIPYSTLMRCEQAALAVNNPNGWLRAMCIPGPEEKR